MRILMVLERDFPPDERVEKEAISLIEAGHEVHIACYMFSKKPEYELYKGIHLHRKRISNFLFKASAACLVIPSYFAFWKKYITSLFHKFSFDAIHIHDLPLSKIGLHFRKKHGVKLVCDQHEYYSNWIVHTAHYNTFTGKIVKLFSNWTKYEKKYLKQADLVITIEEPLRECYINEVGLQPEKVILVPNTPQASVFNLNNVEKSVVEKYKNNFVLFYAGGIDRLRGLEIVIESLINLKNKIPNLVFLVAGVERKGYNILKIAEEYNVSEQLDFIGWVDANELPTLMAASDVCFFTPPANRDEINKTIATKIYQYAAMGKPTITSNAKLMQEFVENNKIGLVASDAQEIETSVMELYTNKELYETFSKNALKIAGNYLWENTISDLISFYNS